ncbi:hypothetical protein [Clostridium intestinale]|jgi:hypothetical protein|uniref:Uncharacterized protein n=2 Tax=Clostridium intestinale TaxID=36845 RepID=U2Q4V4_9CLOT|nr:hypothetical protein [Clostridium intestinale]ERK31139.1 hypothetical protein CINTURNW_1933 [Clostridium intestinale URNW]QLY82194.1 hypothetical protein HZF06_11570 [Clostridium intestinale]
MDITKINLEEFKKLNSIYLDNILDGFNNYPNITIEGTEEDVNNAIKSLVDANGFENSYGDFYYGRIDEEAKNKVKASLKEEEIALIQSLELVREDIFLRLTPELLEILLKLTAKEVLFSTFYFTKYPCLIWGNYGRKYPVFFKDESVMKIVLEDILFYG